MKERQFIETALQQRFVRAQAVAPQGTLVRSRWSVELEKLIKLASLSIVALIASSSLAAGRSAGPTVDASSRRAVIQKLSKELRDRYVFPDRATRAVQVLRAAEAAGAFDQISDPDAFAQAVNASLAATLHDKHLHLEYSANIVPPQSGDVNQPLTPKQLANLNRFLASLNYGLAKAIRLPANVGYLDVLGFPRANLMAPTLAAAMTFPIAHRHIDRRYP